MKAIIVEIKGSFAAALSDDGEVSRLKNENYVLGQVIELQKLGSTRKKPLARLAALAACLLLVCGIGGGAYAYKTPVGYVSLDVNPSVEYTLNMFDRVLAAEAVNEDGEKLLREIDLKTLNNKTIDDAITLTLAEIAREGYFSDGGGIVISASGKKTENSEKLAAHLKALVSARCSENNDTVSVEALSVSREQLSEAKALGVTPGKLLLVQKLIAQHPDDGDFTAEEWLKKPVGEIMAECADAQADADDAAKDAEAEKKDAEEDAREAAEEAEKTAAETAAKPAATSKPHATEKPEPSPSPEPPEPSPSPEPPEPSPSPEPPEPSSSPEPPEPSSSPEPPEPSPSPEPPEPSPESEPPEPSPSPESTTETEASAPAEE
ncbi:MAG: hypothetical protein RR230_06570 [Oscillospiraceae bacterium]